MGELIAWSNHAEQIVTQLIADLSPDRRASTDAVRLNALPIGGSKWAAYYLRPNGDVVIVGEDLDRPDVDSVYNDRHRLLFALAWGSEHYPELLELLPAREEDSRDCMCRLFPSLFSFQKRVCPECGGVGWLPETKSERT